MKKEILDEKGKKTEEIALDDKIFGVKPNEKLIAQYVRVFMANQRQGTSSTKTRAEVSGSGAKPWAQKGLGRARAGSKRSPLWRHGGIVHGPKPKSWNLSLPKKMKTNALFSALSLKEMDKRIFVVNKLDFSKPETKKVLKLLENLNLRNKVLFVTEGENEILKKSLSNIRGVEAVNFNVLNTYQVLNFDNLIFEKKAVESFQKKYKKE